MLSQPRADLPFGRLHLVGIAPGLALAALVGACSATPALVNPQVTPPGSSIAFADGYPMGCLSGFKDANRVGYENAYSKNVTRYGIDSEYRAGWDRGHDACYLEEQLHPRVIGEGSNFK
jgi:hypothetical protein